ncbi:mpv17-like protein [Artemia franciscana]|uniref:mpv17-like protein n=1 Tax=Artemia franciscana TaxID=6661 RepID=UPI0032DBCD10
MNKVRNAFRNYGNITNAMFYGSFYVGAEFSQQTLKIFVFKDPEWTKYDFAAIGRFAVIGMGVNPHILYRWYRFLDSRWPGRSLSAVARKVLMDQFVLTPPHLCGFYTMMSIMEGKADIFEECREKFFQTYRVSCSFWLPAQSVSFLLMPPQYRVAFVGCCVFVWANVLCWFKRRNIEEFRNN